MKTKIKVALLSFTLLITINNICFIPTPIKKITKYTVTTMFFATCLYKCRHYIKWDKILFDKNDDLRKSINAISKYFKSNFKNMGDSGYFSPNDIDLNKLSDDSQNNNSQINNAINNNVIRNVDKVDKGSEQNNVQSCLDNVNQDHDLDNNKNNNNLNLNNSNKSDKPILKNNKFNKNNGDLTSRKAYKRLGVICKHFDEDAFRRHYRNYYE